MNQQGLMAADGIERQGRARIFRRTNFSIGNQTKLYQGLETIADAADKTIPFLQKLHNGIGNGWIAQKRSDKFRGSIRLIAFGKSAGKKQDLTLMEFLYESIHGFSDSLRCKISNH